MRVAKFFAGVVTALAVSLVGASRAVAADQLHLTLPNCLPVGKERKTLEIDLIVCDGRVDPVAWGHTSFVPGLEMPGEVRVQRTPDPLGAVTDASGSDRSARELILQIHLPILHQRERPMFIGGQADLTLRLKPEGDGLTGSWQATFKPLADEAKIAAILEEWQIRPWGAAKDKAVRLSDFQHVRLEAVEGGGQLSGQNSKAPPTWTESLPAAGEHPRLLFSKDDLPAIRAFAQSEEGKAQLAQIRELLEDPPDRSMMLTNGGMRAAGFGFLYQLTGEKQYADRAASACKGPMTLAYAYGQWGQAPYSVIGMALAYDMCYEAWDDAERTAQYAYLEQQIRQIAQRADQPDLVSVRERFDFKNPKSDFVWPPPEKPSQNCFRDRLSAMVAALAVLGDPPMVYRPASPHAAPRIAPAENDEPWFGVPVVDFSDDRMPGRWLMNGPFLRRDVDALRQKVGGLGALRPEPGQIVAVDGVDLDWRMYLPSGHLGRTPRVYVRECGRYFASATGGGYHPGIKLTKLWGQRFGNSRPAVNVWMYTVIRNDRERLVQARPNWGSASWGTRMWLAGREVHDGELLRLSPGLYPLMVDLPIFGGYSNQQPKLVEFSEADYAQAQEKFQAAERAFSGETVRDNRLLENLQCLLRSYRRFVAQQVSDAGHGIEESETPLLITRDVYRRVMGVDIAGGSGLAELATLTLRRDRSSRHTAEILTFGYPTFAPQDQAYARWRLAQEAAPPRSALQGVYALLHQRPGDSVASPAEEIPLAVHDAVRGETHLSNGLAEPLKARVTVQEADGKSLVPNWRHGTVRVWAHGHAFIGGPTPEQPNEVRNALVIDGLFSARPARTLLRELEADGSGVISLDLGPLVEGRDVSEEDEKPRWVFGKKPQPASGRTRLIGVDYSGACGAPVLVILVDRVRMIETREKSVRLNLGRIASPLDDPNKPEALTMREDGFELVQPRRHGRPENAARMRVTYVGPRRPELLARAVGEDRLETCVDAILDRDDTLKERVDKKLVADLAAGFDTRGDDIIGGFTDELAEGEANERGAIPSALITVITIGHDEPPEVAAVASHAADETGQDGVSEVTVGRRRVRIEPQRITFY